MLSRQQLEIINRKTLRYPLQIAEKDYLLALVLQLITDSPLGEKLIFKGGTAIHHFPSRWKLTSSKMFCSQ